MDRSLEWRTLLERLGFSSPHNLDLYEEAFTHPSLCNDERVEMPHYERLEFLGDAVIKLIVSEYLFECFPEYREGDLTKIRSVIVSDAVLAQLTKELALFNHLRLGYSEEKTNGRDKTSNLACCFEAFVGALFMDGKTLETRDWLRALLEDKIAEVDASETKQNFKAYLQEWAQANGKGLPEYVIVQERGPAHNKAFTAQVQLMGIVVGEGEGRSKKEAQQQAAYQALRYFDCLPSDEMT